MDPKRTPSSETDTGPKRQRKMMTTAKKRKLLNFLKVGRMFVSVVLQGQLRTDVVPQGQLRTDAVTRVNFLLGVGRVV